MLRRLMAAVGMLEVEDGNYIDGVLSPLQLLLLVRILGGFKGFGIEEVAC